MGAGIDGEFQEDDLDLPDVDSNMVVETSSRRERDFMEVMAERAAQRGVSVGSSAISQSNPIAVDAVHDLDDGFDPTETHQSHGNVS